MGSWILTKPMRKCEGLQTTGFTPPTLGTVCTILHVLALRLFHCPLEVCEDGLQSPGDISLISSSNSLNSSVACCSGEPLGSPIVFGVFYAQHKEGRHERNTPLLPGHEHPCLGGRNELSRRMMHKSAQGCRASIPGTYTYHLKKRGGNYSWK